MRSFILFFIFYFTVSAAVFAHDLHHHVSQEKVKVVTFSFGSVDSYAFQKYEVYAPDAKIPFSVGRTDKLSRVMFMPDKSGLWKVKVMSDDGHGAVVNVDIDESMSMTYYSQSLYEKFQKIFVGLAFIFAIFALIYMLKRRKKGQE